MSDKHLGINRRDFVKGVAALGLTTGMLGIRNMAMAAEGSTFTFGRIRETKHLDPHSSQLSSSWHIQHMVYDSLVTLDDNFEVQPSIATAWEWQGNTLVFTIRDNAVFANGRAMTMEDVTVSLNRALKSKGNPWGLLLRNKTAITAMDGNKLSIEFNGPNNVALSSLAATLVCIVPTVEEASGEWDPKTDMFMGTGPYSVESHTANDRWVLKANPHYWGGAPKTDTVVVRTIPQAQSLVAALRDGSIDAASFDGNPDAPALLEGAPDIEISRLDTTDFYYIGMNAVAEGSPFLDKSVRQAVAMCIDRKQLIEFAFAGRAGLTYGWTQWGLTDDSKLPIREPDIEKAKAMIEAANLPTNKIKVLVREGDTLSAVAQVLKQSAAKIGLDLELEVVDGGVWAKRTWGTNPSDMQMVVSRYTGFAHPLIITAHWWAPEMSRFTKGYVPENPEYSAALNKAVLESTGDEITPSLQKAYEILNEEAVKVPLCTDIDTIAWRSDRVTMSPSREQAQNDILSGVETFEMKTFDKKSFFIFVVHCGETGSRRINDCRCRYPGILRHAPHSRLLC